MRRFLKEIWTFASCAFTFPKTSLLKSARTADPPDMTPASLDALFPYICFAYGAVMTFTLNVPALVRIADEKLPPDVATQWKSHRVFGTICLLIGALWILQNLWLAH